MTEYKLDPTEYSLDWTRLPRLWPMLCIMLDVLNQIVMKNYRNIAMTVALTGLFCIIGATGQVTKPKQVVLSSQPTYTLAPRTQSAFQAGEKLTYRLHYGFVDAGEAIVEVKETNYERLGRKMFHVVGTGYSLGAFNWFFKVKDRYESYLDKESLMPWKFVRRIEEGGYKKSQDYIFHHNHAAVDNGKGEVYEIPIGVQDMISSFYYARSMDFSNAKSGDQFTIKTFMDDEVYDLNIRYVGKETVSLRNGKFRCMKFVPVVQEGRIFKDSEDLQVWITDDQNKIPILAKANILVGSIKMEVVDYKGLANPIARVN
jgi:hypothetical protein